MPSALGAFDPTDVLDLAYWDARDLSLSDGATISSWQDRSGTYTLSQGTVADRPIFSADVASSGYPGVTFDGVSEHLQNDAGLALQLQSGQPYTAYVIARTGPMGNSTFETIWSLGTNVSTNGFLMYRWPQGSAGDRSVSFRSEDLTIVYAEDWDIGSGAADEVSIVTFSGYNGLLNAWTNRTQYVSDVATLSGGTAAFYHFTVGCLNRNSTLANFWGGSVHAIGFASRVLDASERAQLEDYANENFGL